MSETISFLLTDDECLPLIERAEYYSRDINGQAKFMVLEKLGLRKEQATEKAIAQVTAQRPKAPKPATPGTTRQTTDQLSGSSHVG